MMNWLVKWGVKKWLLDVVNKALSAYKVNIDRARAIVAAAIAKTEAVVAFLKSLDAKLADSKLDEAEADALVEEATKLAKELVG